VVELSTERQLQEIHGTYEFFKSLKKEAFGKEEDYLNTILQILRLAQQIENPKFRPLPKEKKQSIVERFNRVINNLYDELLQLKRNYSPARAREFAAAWMIKQRRLYEFQKGPAGSGEDKVRAQIDAVGMVSSVQISLAFKNIRRKIKESWQNRVLEATEELIKQEQGPIQTELLRLLRIAGEKEDFIAELKTLELLISLYQMGWTAERILEEIRPLKGITNISSLIKWIYDVVYDKIHYLKRKHEPIPSFRITNLQELYQILEIAPQTSHDFNTYDLFLNTILNTKYRDQFLIIIEVEKLLKHILDPLEAELEFYKKDRGIVESIFELKGNLLGRKIQRKEIADRELEREIGTLVKLAIDQLNELINLMRQHDLQQAFLSKELIHQCELYGIHLSQLRKEVKIPKSMIIELNTRMQEVDKLYMYLEKAIDQRAAIEITSNESLGRTLLNFNDFLTHIIDTSLGKTEIIKIPAKILELRQITHYLQRIETLITILSIEFPRNPISPQMTQLLLNEISDIRSEYFQLNTFKRQILEPFEKELLRISPQLVIEFFQRPQYLKNPSSFQQVLNNFIEELNLARLNGHLTPREYKSCQHKIHRFINSLKFFAAILSKNFTEERIKLLKYL